MKFYVPSHLTALTLEGHSVPLDEKDEQGIIEILGIQPHHLEQLEAHGVLPIHDNKPKKVSKLGAPPSPEDVAVEKTKLAEAALKDHGVVLDKRKSLSALKTEVEMITKGLKRAPSISERAEA